MLHLRLLIRDQSRINVSANFFNSRAPYATGSIRVFGIAEYEHRLIIWIVGWPIQWYEMRWKSRYWKTPTKGDVLNTYWKLILASLENFSDSFLRLVETVFEIHSDTFPRRFWNQSWKVEIFAHLEQSWFDINLCHNWRCLRTIEYLSKMHSRIWSWPCRIDLIWYTP